MAAIRVVINGITGRMGTETVAALLREEGLELVGGVSRQDRGPLLTLPNGESTPLSTDLKQLLTNASPDVLVDFTNAAACMEAATEAAGKSVNLVWGPAG